MVKKALIIAIFLLPMLATSAQAQTTCSALPNNLTNGATANASQVMANFTYLLGCINGLRGYLGGLTMSNDETNPNTVIDTAAGVADSDDVAATMMSLSAFVKNANAAWAVGSGNGCLDSGSALAASTWYHLFVIARTDTGIVDELCSTSATSPTLPAGYSKKRRIGSFKTDGSTHILGFSQVGDKFMWATPVQDVNLTIPDTDGHLVSLSVPSGVICDALLTGHYATSGSGSPILYLSSPQQTDLPAGGAGGGYTAQINGTNLTSFQVAITTNTSQQVRYRAQDATSTTLLMWTNGWIDTRGRFN